ncbi:MAG: hypothetical protein ACRC7S_18720 [Cetobacterium sp.]
MATRIVTYVQPRNKGGNVDTSKLATKVELQEGVQEAKNYTDDAIQAINDSGGSSHIHANMALLNEFKEVNGELYFKDINLNASNIIFETVEG